MPREEVATHNGAEPFDIITVEEAPIGRRLFIDGLEVPYKISPLAA
jgi:hypothetical protein